MSNKTPNEAEADLGYLLYSLEMSKMMLAEQSPRDMYSDWLKISAHYAAASNMILRNMLNNEDITESTELLRGIHRAMLGFIKKVQKACEYQRESRPSS